MSGRFGVGMDVGGTKVLAVALDADGTKLAEGRTDAPSELAGLAASLGALITEVVTSLASSGEPGFLGLALPGLVDRSGTLRAAPNLGAADVSYDLRRELSEPLGPLAHTDPGAVVFENDSTAAAVADVALGAARGHDDALVVSLGTGIGAGIVSGGKVLRGANGYAGEIGHTIVDPAGPECPCGRRGCWERFASGSGLAYLGTRHGAIEPGGRGEDVVARAREGDEAAAFVIEEWARYLAIGLSNATELLDPGIIVLAGGLVTSADVWLEPARRAYEEFCRPALARSGSDLVLTSLGEDAAALGVAALGLGLLT